MSWDDKDIDDLFRGAQAPEPPPFREAYWEEMESMLDAGWSDGRIDQLFQGAGPDAVPPFKDAYWQEMEAMLPQEKKRRRAAFWWIPAGIAAALLIVFALRMNRSEATAEPQAAGKAAPVKAVPQNGQPVQASTRQTASGTAATGDDATGHIASAIPAVREQIGEAVIRTPRIIFGEPGEDPVIQPEASVLSDAVNAAVPNRTTAEKMNGLDPFPVAYGRPSVPDSYPNITFPRTAEERYYVQVSAGIGQSAQRDVKNASGLLHYYAFGGGLYKRIDNMILTCGANVRMDAVSNIVNTQYDPNGNRVETAYNTLYSLETPLSIGFNYGRNTFGATVTPGFQTGFSGHRSEFENDQLIRSEHLSGKLQNARTLTMEFGVNYWRTLRPNWHLGAAFNIDALRPFNIGTFAGQQRLLPMNGQIVLRRTF